MPTLQPRRDLPDMSAEMVASRRFGQSWRGYDQEEVKQFLAEVADQVRVLRERAERAESSWREAEERAAHPRLDEATLMSALGAETAEILRSAHNAAAEVLSKAEATAERITSEAQTKADGLVARAESLLAERTGEAERAATELLEQARAEAERTLSGAVEQASAQSEEAQHKADELVKSAEATREQVLAELARRRKLATVQIEQLRAGRERLLAAYLTVRRTLDEVTEELQRADAEARAASDAVGRQHAGEMSELAVGQGEEVWPSPSRNEPAQAISIPAGGPVVLAPKAGELAASQRDRAHSPGDHGPGGHSSAGARATLPDDHRGALVSAAAEFESVRILRPPSDTGSAADEPTTAEVPAPAVAPEVAAGEHGRGGERPSGHLGAGSPVAGELGGGPDEVLKQPAGGRGGAAPAGLGGGAEQPPRSASGEAGVEDLFARIKAGRAEATSRAKRALEGSNGRRNAGQLAETGEESPPARAGEPGRPAPSDGRVTTSKPSSLPSDEDHAEERPDALKGGARVNEPGASFIAERDQLSGRLAGSLARKLKRALQDEQNALLDKLRNLRGSPEAVLPSAEEHPDRFAEAGRPLLEEAAKGGIRLMAEFYSATGTGELGAEIVDDLAFDLGRAIAEPLRERLEQALRGGGEGSELADALGAAYREWKTQRIEEAARDQVAAAFSRGAYVALPEGSRLQWAVVAGEGPCPDCEDNALARDLAKGEPWPTGQLHPPAHPGCRCALLPQQGTSA